MKKIAFLCIILILIILVSCSEGKTENTGAVTTAQDNTPPDNVQDLFDFSSPSIIIHTGLSKNVRSAVLKLKDAIDQRFCTDTGVFSEETKQTDPENTVFIGDDRIYNISGIEAPDKNPFYSVIRYGKNVVIYGKSEQGILQGVKFFMENNVLNGDGKTFVSEENGKKDGVVFSDLTQFSVEYTNTIYTPDSTESKEQCTYGKIIKLEHNGDKNGILLATRETVGGGDDRYPIYRSTDNGNTWKQYSVITDSKNKNMIAGWQPFIYELPADIGEFKEGTVIVAGCSRNTGTINHSVITLYRSNNQGKTFLQFANIDEKGGIGNGMWEPYLIYEESRGRLYCFYSEDAPEDKHSQRLVYRYTTDLVNWSEKKECVACTNPDMRPGMVCITKMGNGKYILTFEMVGIAGNPVHYKITDDLDDWGKASDYGKKIITASGKGIGSCPWCVWTPAGGECGTLIVTGMLMASGSSKTGTDMFLSFDYGETFVSVDNPIPYVTKDGVRCGYSAGMFVDSEGTVYYVNNTNYGEKNEKMMFAILKIK